MDSYHNILIIHSFHIPINFQCLATIASVYWRSNEESVEGDRPQRAPVLETRQTVSPNSRADRVQGNYVCDNKLSQLKFQLKTNMSENLLIIYSTHMSEFI